MSHADSAGDAPNAPRRAWLGLLVLALPALLLSVDVSVLYLAVPTLSRDLGASNIEQLWILDIYSFLLAGFLVTMGGLADRVGRRRVMLIGAAAFGAASVAAAFATTPTALIAARAVLGIAGATLMPTTLATVRHLFAGTRHLNSAMGVWFACFMVGMLAGPLVGGVLLAKFFWGAVFLLGVPVMLLLLVAGPAILPESRNETPGRMDPVSVILSVATLLPMAWAVKEIARGGVTLVPVLALAVALAVGWLFVTRQRRLTDPLVDLALFRVRAFTGALSISAVGGIVMAGTSLVAAIYLQSVVGLAPIAVGLWLIPQNIAMILGFAVVPVLAKRLAERYVIAGGLLVAAVGFALLAVVDPRRFGVLLLGMGLASFGVAAPMALGATVLMATAPPERAGSAASIMETSGELGVAVGVATLGSLAVGAYRLSLGSSPALGDSGERDVALRGIEDAFTVAAQQPGTAGEALADAARTAFVSGVHVVGIVAAVTFTLLAVLAVRLLVTPATPRTPTNLEPATA